MVIYEPVGHFVIKKSEMEKLCGEILKMWPDRVIFDGKTFGAFEEYKCDSLTRIYKIASDKLDQGDFGKWEDLSPIVFDFISRAIKDASVYLKFMNRDQVDISPIIKDLGAREDIVIV